MWMPVDLPWIVGWLLLMTAYAVMRMYKLTLSLADGAG